MTEQQPDSEYIITGFQLKQLQEHMDLDFVCQAILSRPHNPPPKFSSEDLILLAHDEWKRREERKHNLDEVPWVAGFLSGFCTSHKWAREYVDKLRSK